LDVSRLAALGWRVGIPLGEGLRDTVDLFRQQLQADLVRL
jgi:nucleoside-diphosphate-sugar epimerase